MLFRSIHKSFLVLLSVLAMGSLPWGNQARAVDIGSGEVEANLDTTLSYGVTFRAADRDKKLVTDPNGNDGNLNYKRGIVSNAFKFTTDLDVGYRNFGLFLRGSGFLDIENENGTRERTPLSAKAKRMVGKDIDLLDAYVTGAFEIGEATTDVRIGKHVLNWGESTFIQNGINAVNPFDVGKLRVPGAELREALVAVPLASTVVELPNGLSVEGFYQLDWDKTEIDPVGSYFSVTDYVGAGARQAEIDVTSLLPTIQPNDRDDFLFVQRGPDRVPGDSGQFGVGLRFFAEDLGNTEFGFYFMNYHSRLPLVTARSGTRLGITQGLGLVRDTIGRFVIGTDLQAAASAALMDSNGASAGAAAARANPAGMAAFNRVLAAGGTPQQAAAAAIAAVPQIAGPAAIAAASEAAAVGAARANPVGMAAFNQVLAAGGTPQQAAAAAVAAVPGAADAGAAAAINRYGKDARYFVEYPEDIQLFGVSFNTQLGTSGWALQGEYSYRRDAPLQIDDVHILTTGLRPISTALACQLQPQSQQLQCIGNAMASIPADGGPVQGFVLSDVSQAQVTATRVFGPTLGADSLAFVTEVALMHVHDMPNKMTTPLESPADITVGADATSFGYRMASRLDYNNAIGAVNLFPYAQFQHDVSGNSPSPSGSFVQGRTALTLGLRASYLSRWEADIGYTSFAGRRNKLRDRDLVTATVKYSF